MGADRFVRFQEEGPRPSIAEVRAYVEAFFGGLGKIEEVAWDRKEQRPMWMITVPGNYSDPERNLPDEGEPARWIEVWPHGPVGALEAVNVETRQMDPLTSAIATGLANSMARKWLAEVEP